MNSRHLLNEHPSVQDLQMSSGGVNRNKFMQHQYAINSGPMMNDYETRSERNAKKVAKDQTITVVKNEENIRRAQMDMQKALKRSTRSPQNKRTAGAAGSAQVAAAKLPAIGSGNISPTLSNNSGATRASREDYPYNDPAAHKKYKEDKKNMNSLKGKSMTGGKAPSLVSTVFSYDAGSEDDSCSIYSCSCCHVRKTSTVGTASSACSSCSSATGSSLSQYENMTSISQRTPNSLTSSQGVKSYASGSSKIRKLEKELHQERHDREATMKDLADIQKRQALLLAKLSVEERAEISKITGGR